MKRENFFGRSASETVIDGVCHGGRDGELDPPRRFSSGGAAAESRHPLHQQDRIQDTATYNCSCGLVFEAEVHATVGCPHCGTRQAW